MRLSIWGCFGEVVGRVRILRFQSWRIRPAAGSTTAHASPAPPTDRGVTSQVSPTPPTDRGVTSQVSPELPQGRSTTSQVSPESEAIASSTLCSEYVLTDHCPTRWARGETRAQRVGREPDVLAARSADRAVEIVRGDEAGASDSGETCEVVLRPWGSSGETCEVERWICGCSGETCEVERWICGRAGERRAVGRSDCELWGDTVRLGGAMLLPVQR